MKPLLYLIACVTLGGCTLDPNFTRPEPPVPAQWPVGGAYGQRAQSLGASENVAATGGSATPSEMVAQPVAWQEFVRDARLKQVIDLALSNNRDIRRAIANIESARAQYRIERSALVPAVSAGGDYSRSRSNVAFGAENTSVVSSAYSVSAGLSAYEIDFFGRVRSLSRAALEQYLATEEAGRTTRATVVAEVSNAYIQLASDRALLEVSLQTQESAQKSIDLIRARLSVGIASRTELRQAETIFNQARADVANYRTLIEQDRNALQLLVGEQVRDDLIPNSLTPESMFFHDVPAGMSSAILLERPDVVQAEHTLRAANANIGAARAAFFPRISLTASGGWSSNELSSLFSSGSRTWSFAPSISLPIFDGGYNRANLAYSQAQRDAMLADYELAIQTGFKEVADALARSGTIDEQRNAQRALYEAALDTYGLTEAKYRRGIGGFLDALDAQRTLYSARQSYLTTLQTALENQVALYRALGGGV
ncbi:MAG: efflux transporter outer membrane subunit [Burkholderiaceae bacterium]